MTDETTLATESVPPELEQELEFHRHLEEADPVDRDPGPG